MDEILLKVEIEQKFKNHLIPKLPEIIYGGLLQKEDILTQVMKKEFDVDNFIYYLVKNYSKEVEYLNIYIINQLLKYLRIEVIQND